MLVPGETPSSAAQITPGMGPQRWALIIGALTPAATVGAALGLAASRGMLQRDWVLSIALVGKTLLPVGAVSAGLCAWRTWRTKEHGRLAALLWAIGYVLSALLLLFVFISIGQVWG